MHLHVLHLSKSKTEADRFEYLFSQLTGGETRALKQLSLANWKKKQLTNFSRVQHDNNWSTTYHTPLFTGKINCDFTVFKKLTEWKKTT